MDARTKVVVAMRSGLLLLGQPIVRLTAVALVASALVGAFISYAPFELAKRGYPTWLGLAAPLVGSLIALFALLDFDRVTFLTFAVIGFVQIEPAPFDLLLVMLLGIGLLTGRLLYPSRTKETGILIGLWGLAVMNTLSALGVVPSGNSLHFLVITLYGLALFAFVRMYTVTPAAVRVLVNGYTLSAVASVLLAGLGFLDVGPAERLFTVSGMRAQGFFKDPNVFAPFLILPILVMADAAMQRSFSWRYTIPRILLVVLLSNGVLLSFSRAAWVNLLVSGFLYLALLSRVASRRQLMISVCLVAVICLAGTLLIQAAGFSDLALQRWGLRYYDIQRFTIQVRGVVAGLSHPLGVGPGRWTNAHSLYARTLAEQGVLGLAALAVLIVSLLLGVARHVLHEPLRGEALPARVLLPCLVGQLVNSLVIDSIHWRHLWMVFGLAWAALDTRGRQRE